MNVLIIGGGQVGEYLAKLMLDNNFGVRIIDNRESIIEKLKTKLPSGIICHGSGTDPNVLETCGINNADVVAAVTGEDEINLVASTIAKFEFNVPRVIGRVNNPGNAWLYNASMGVDVALNQADLMARLIIEEIDIKNILTLMKINHGNRSIVQIKVDAQSPAAGKQVSELNVPPEALLIAVFRGEEVIIPRGGTEIRGGDSVLAFTNNEALIKLNKIFSL